MFAALPAGIGAISEVGQDPDRGSKVNQDAYFALELPCGGLCAGVMDGHGKKGHDVTKHLQQSFPVFLNQAFQSEPADVERTLGDVFEAVNADAMSTAGVDSRLSGTTCVVAVLLAGVLYVAHVGDSRAVLGQQLGDGNWQAVPLTEASTARRPEERERILKKGGRIDPSFNVWAGPIGVAMTRALGDSVLHSVGLICQPELFTRTLEPGDSFLALVTDGVSDVVTDGRMVEIVSSFAVSAEAEARAMDSSRVAQTLVDEAREKWQAGLPLDVKIDDTTAVIVPLGGTRNAAL